MSIAIDAEIVGELVNFIRLNQGIVGHIAHRRVTGYSDQRKTVRLPVRGYAGDPECVEYVEIGVFACIGLGNEAPVVRQLDVLNHGRRPDPSPVRRHVVSLKSGSAHEAGEVFRIGPQPVVVSAASEDRVLGAKRVIELLNGGVRLGRNGSKDLVVEERARPILTWKVSENLRRLGCNPIRWNYVAREWRA